MENNKIRVLMIGPARNVKGGMTTVVDNYFKYGLDKLVDLKYVETCNDSNKLAKFIKEKKGNREFNKEIDNCDIVHVHMASRRSTFRKGKYVRIAKRKGKKVIIHIHGGCFKKFYSDCNEREKKYVRETLNLADNIIVLSEEWKQYFKNLTTENKIIIIYNSVKIPQDFQKFFYNKKVLFLGRIVKR